MDACDIECQRNKELKRLSSNVVNAIANKDKDPEAYEKAKVAYYTAKDGQEFASKDKEEKAKQEAQTTLDSYQKRFDDMKNILIQNSALKQAKKDIENSQVGDEDELRYIHSEIEKERDDSSVQQRLKELAGLPQDVYWWLPSFLDLVLGIGILYLVYQIFVQGKLSRITLNSQSPG